MNIEPCPFCKCESIYDKEYENEVFGKMFVMACDQCQAEGPLSATLKIAEYAWNKRGYDYDMPAIVKKVKQLEKENEQLKKMLALGVNYERANG